MMRKILKAVGLIFLFLFIYFFAQNFVGLVLGIIHGIQSALSGAQSGGEVDVKTITEDLLRYISAQTSWIVLVAVIISLPTFYLFYRNRRQELMTFISLRGIGAFSIPVLMLFGLSLNFVLEALLSLLSQINFLSKIFEAYSQLANALFSGNFVLSLIAIGIVGPIFEEILFRGLVFGELRKIAKLPLAILIQALLFGAYHLNAVQGTYAFLIGLLLGYIYYRSNSIIAPVIIHITINASSVILPQLISDSQLEKWSGVIIAASIILLIVTGAFILMSRSFKRSMDNSLYERNQAPVLPPPGDNQQNGL